MNEHELRSALREAMAGVAPPRPVTANSALTRAHRAQRRRRANMAGIGVGAVVVALVAGAFTLSARTVGEVGRPSDTHTSAPPLTGGESDQAPVGSPQYATGERLLAAVSTALPPGFHGADEKLSEGAKIQPRRHEEIKAGTSDTWIYRALEPVTFPGRIGIGELTVQVFGPGNGLPTDICAAAQDLAHGASCTVRQVGGKSVGLVTRPDDTRVSAAVVYRYADGTVVGVTQSRTVYGFDLQPMNQPPLTDDQLASFVLTPGLKVV